MMRERLLLLFFALLLTFFTGVGCRTGRTAETVPPEAAENVRKTTAAGEKQEETAAAKSEEATEQEEKADSAAAVPAHEGAWTPSELENTLGGKDPIEGFNRAMFSCTDFIMNYFVDPVGRVYTSILPRPVIEKFNNLCVNLEFPTRAFSCLFRAEWRGAGDETARFFINTTLGIAGLFDPAADWFDFYSTESDFGQTFAAWGIGPGCTLILPLMSTLNVRDTVASIFDMAFDIKTYIPYAGYATALNRMVIAHRAYSKAVEGSSDPYKSYRELALLRRELQMKMYFYHAQNQAAAARKAKEKAEEAVKEAEESGDAEQTDEAKKALAALLPPLPDRRTTPKPETLTGDWISIPGYDGQSPLLDTLRVGMFQAQIPQHGGKALSPGGEQPREVARMQPELLCDTLAGERGAEVLLQILPDSFVVPLRLPGLRRTILRQPCPGQPEQAAHQIRRRVAGIAVTPQLGETVQNAPDRLRGRQL